MVRIFGSETLRLLQDQEESGLVRSINAVD